MSRLFKSIIAGLLTGMLGLVASLVTIGLDLEENIGLDLLFKLRGIREAPSDVIIVTIDRASADNLNLPTEPKKWPRSLHASLTDILAREGAAVIAFDIIFDEARSTVHDNLFAEAISKVRNVVLCECLKKDKLSMTDEGGTQTGDLHIERLVPPIPPLARSAVALAPFPLPKVPVKVSQYWTFKTDAGGTPTLPIVVFQIYALEAYDEFIRLLDRVSPTQTKNLPRNKDTILSAGGVERLVRVLRSIFKEKPLVAEKMLEEVKNSRRQSADLKKNQMLESLIRMYQGDDSRYLNFYGPAGTITTVPYYQVLKHQKKSAIKHNQLDFHGKAVFVGLSERLRPEQKDGFYTVFSQASGLDISGVEIAATAFANMVEDMPVRPLGFRVHLLTVFLWGVILGILCRLFPTVIAAVSVIGLGVVYLITARHQFTFTGSWYPLVTPLFFQAPLAFFGTVMWKYIDTSKERRNIRKAFEYYIPDKVVDQLTQNVAAIQTTSQSVYGTCLITDVAKYTDRVENIEPKELRGSLNKYFESVFEPVRQHRGIVSDLRGDSVLALWATADRDVILKKHACLAALDIAKAVHRFNQSSDTLKLPTRMGLHSGHMLLGNVGALDHYEYRPLGDIVNTVSRIEGVNKHLDTQILASEEVLSEVDGFLTRELGQFILVGKSKPIVIYELVCRMEESNEQKTTLCTIFTEALSAFRKKSWDEAIDIFSELMKIIGEDGPSHFYLKLCENYKKNPPGEMWNGLVTLDIK